ncbi:MAG: hypothetical protein ACI8QD_000277 [Cyclobacteriaceae bacterium]|jgi:hypothetical protein
MSRLIYILIALSTACGDVGIAINVSKELPIKVTFQQNIDSVSIALEELVSYNLEDVDAFEEYLPRIEEAGKLQLNQLSFSLDSISDLESQSIIDLLEIRVFNAGDTLLVWDNPSQLLQNQAQSAIPIPQATIDKIQGWLFNKETVYTLINFELGGVPQTLGEVKFQFTVYFDATLKARNISL